MPHQMNRNPAKVTRQSISLSVNEDHPAYLWAKRQADAVNAFGHIGTHIDCYTKVPSQNHYLTDVVVIECNSAMPSIKVLQ